MGNHRATGCACPGPDTGPGCADPPGPQVSRTTCTCADTGDLMRAALEDHDLNQPCGLHQPWQAEPTGGDDFLTTALNDDAALTGRLKAALYAPETTEGRTNP